MYINSKIKKKQKIGILHCTRKFYDEIFSPLAFKIGKIRVRKNINIFSLIVITNKEKIYIFYLKFLTSF